MATQWIRRTGSRERGFRYVDAAGKRVPRAATARIEALRIPPAWTGVHVATSERTAIQAWGFDARGRKQYRYNASAVQKGQLRKYYRVRQMARDLPRIRKRLDADFRARGLGRDKVIAGIVLLVADGFFRIGSERYARENHTFGITTLRKSHVTVEDSVVTFEYVGKRSIRHRRVVVSRDLSRFVAALLETPGRRLFRYQSDAGWRDVDSREVNDYLQSLAGFPYTAKDFRTWGGTLRAATVLGEIGPARSEAEAKKNVVMAVRLVASELGNTPAICRASYVHPAVLDRYVESGETIRWKRGSPRPGGGRDGGRYAHTPEERALVAFLDEHFPERRGRRRAA